MSDGNTGQNQLVTYLLIAIVVLLATIVGVVVWQNNKAATPAPIASQPTTPPTQPGMGSSTGVEFDAATATKVPAGMKVDEYVKKYYQSIIDKKWQAAFDMQPAASKSGTVQDFQATQEGYGMKSFKILESKTSGDEATVKAEQDLGANGIWGATWTFVKSGSTWAVKQRAVSMGQ